MKKSLLSFLMLAVLVNPGCKMELQDRINQMLKPTPSPGTIIVEELAPERDKKAEDSSMYNEQAENTARAAISTTSTPLPEGTPGADLSAQNYGDGMQAWQQAQSVENGDALTNMPRPTVGSADASAEMLPKWLMEKLTGQSDIHAKVRVYTNAGVTTLNAALEFFQQEMNIATITQVLGAKQRIVYKNGILYIIADQKKEITSIDSNTLGSNAAGLAAISYMIGSKVMPTKLELESLRLSGRAYISSRLCDVYTGKSGQTGVRFYTDSQTGMPVRFEIGENANVTIDYELVDFSKVDESVFRVPEDYSSVSYAKMLGLSG